MMVGDLLRNKIAVVIGGAGVIGAACCRAFAEQGAKIAVADLSVAAAERVAVPYGGLAFGINVEDELSVASTLEAIEHQLGPVDIVVNAAAVFQAPGPVSRLKLRKWDEVTRVAHRGNMLICSRFGLAMVSRGRGAIVSIASIAGMRSLPLHAYAPAKAAVIATVQSLAPEFGRSSVRINAISPGFTRTSAVEQAIKDGRYALDSVLAGTPLGRLVEPDEVAAAALFLASPAASGITGINLPVDCGWLAGSSWQAYGGLPDMPVHGVA